VQAPVGSFLQQELRKIRGRNEVVCLRLEVTIDTASVRWVAATSLVVVLAAPFAPVHAAGRHDGSLDARLLAHLTGVHI
jgi:hypothetical protein